MPYANINRAGMITHFILLSKKLNEKTSKKNRAPQLKIAAMTPNTIPASYDEIPDKIFLPT